MYFLCITGKLNIDQSFALLIGHSRDGREVGIAVESHQVSECSGKGIKAVSKHRAGSSYDSSFHSCFHGIWIKDQILYLGKGSWSVPVPH